MKRKLFGFGAALALSAAAFTGGSASAAAYGTNFTVSITYQNVSPSDAAVTFHFFPEANGTEVTVNPPPGGTLASKASASLNVGSVQALGPGFKGSGYLTASQPVIATMVQFDPAGNVKNRPVSNGFDASAGSAQQTVATVLKQGTTGQYNTIFSVQNTDTASADVTVNYYAVGATTATATVTQQNLPPNAAKYFDAQTIAGLPADFTGSAIVTAKQSGSTNPGKIVVSVNELQATGNYASSFEGASTSGTKVFMPSALCKLNNADNVPTYSTAYAVSNASQTDSVDFKVTYKFSVGGQPQADITDPATGTYTIPAGGKKSLQGCAALPPNAIGSAIVERVTGNGSLVVVGKVFGGNISSSFLGYNDGTGSNRVAMPYVRFAPPATFNNASRQRTFIAIQNIGTTAATNVSVQYVDKDGVLRGTHTIGTIAPGAKVSSNPGSGPAATNALDACGRFGEYGGITGDYKNGTCDNPAGTSFGGGAIVVADSGAQLATVVRVASGEPTLAGEDYNGQNATSLP